MKENEEIINYIQNENFIEENENIFNQLLSFQLLLQKNTGLKELCKY